MKAHFIAIGGSVMHQLAIALKNKGYDVSGSDDEIFEPARSNLLKAGLLPSVNGWFADKITSSLDAIILGMHAREDNPELQKARLLNIPVYSFPEYIFEESKNKTRVVIGGSHGKTTITAMIMHVLRECGMQFDYLVGAQVEGFEYTVKISGASVIICEGDEYPASVLEKQPKFHFLAPHIAVISGIAWDHINIFPTFENYLDQFRIFIDKIEKNGTLIYNETDPVLNDLIKHHNREDIHYLPYKLPTYKIKNGITTVQFDKASAPLKIFGRHNLLNVNAARLVCRQLDINESRFANFISTFRGASRRLELLAQNDHTAIYRDFAHAPSKVKATIQAVKEQYPRRNLIAVLELHTYSSLNAKFLNQYADAMEAADIAVIFYSSHALQIKRLPALNAKQIKEGFHREDVNIFHEVAGLINFLDAQVYLNTNLLLMSSGNFDGMDLDDIIKHV